jgi:hypothetical protein
VIVFNYVAWCVGVESTCILGLVFVNVVYLLYSLLYCPSSNWCIMCICSNSVPDLIMGLFVRSLCVGAVSSMTGLVVGVEQGASVEALGCVTV